MSIQATAWAIEQHEVPARPALVLQALANHASHVDGRCWPSIDTIAREARCSRRAVFGYLAALERNGYVEIVRTRKKSGRQGVNNYYLLFNRDPAPWHHFSAPPDDPEPPIAAEDAEAVEAIEAEPQEGVDLPDVDSRVQNAHPENLPPECKASAPGQSAPVCTRHVMPEPSDSRTSEFVERAGREPLTMVVPPSHRPQARTERAAASMAAEEEKPKQVFVFEGSDAWNAWQRHLQAKRGRGTPTTTASIDGKTRRGWWFWTLYPPKESAVSTGPPTLMSPDDEKEMAREMGR